MNMELCPIQSQRHLVITCYNPVMGYLLGIGTTTHIYIYARFAEGNTCKCVENCRRKICSRVAGIFIYTYTYIYMFLYPKKNTKFWETYFGMRGEEKALQCIFVCLFWCVCCFLQRANSRWLTLQ